MATLVERVSALEIKLNKMITRIADNEIDIVQVKMMAKKADADVGDNQQTIRRLRRKLRG